MRLKFRFSLVLNVVKSADVSRILICLEGTLNLSFVESKVDTQQEENKPFKELSV